MKTRLAEIIQSRGLERKQIASDLEIERRTLDNYINEYTLMHSDIIRKMAQYFNVSTDYLLGIDNLDDEFLNEKIDIITKELKEIVYHLKKKILKFLFSGFFSLKFLINRL